MRSEKFSTLLATKGNDARLLFSYGQALLEEGNTKEALKPLQSCTQDDSEWMMPRILLGKAYIQVGNVSAARTWLEAALQLAINQKHEDPEAEIRELLADL